MLLLIILYFIENQDMHVLVQKSSSILPITLFELKTETSASEILKYISIYLYIISIYGIKKHNWVGKSKTKDEDATTI